jgi:hypothetical protein
MPTPIAHGTASPRYHDECHAPSPDKKGKGRTMRLGGPPASRRTVVTGVITAAAAAATRAPALAARQVATPGWSPYPVAGAPAWTFAVHTVEEPYTGTMQVPAEIANGSRVVAIEVEITNEADQALNFTPVDVRLRDDTGQEYRGGAAIGTEPMISPRNLNPGERSRGWVWFVVPEATIPVEIVYVAPQPQFRIPLG